MSTTREDTKLPIPAKGSLAGREKIPAWPKSVFVETGLVKAYQAGNPAADTQREIATSPALMAAGFMLTRKSARAHLLPPQLCRPLAQARLASPERSRVIGIVAAPDDSPPAVRDGSGLASGSSAIRLSAPC